MKNLEKSKCASFFSMFAGCCVLILSGVSSLSALTTNIAQGKCDVARCVNYGDPAKAFDGDTNTSSTGNVDGFTGMLAVDLGGTKSLLKTAISFPGNNPASYYKIQGSDNGTYWTDILRVFNAFSPRDERMLPAVSYRYVRFVLPFGPSCGECDWFAISTSEIAIYERGAGDPAGDPPIIYPSPIDHAGWSAKTINGTPTPEPVSGTDQGFYDPHGGLGNGGVWHSNSGLASGDGFEVDMGSSKDFNQIHINYDHDPIRGYVIQVSDNATTWDSVTSGNLVSFGLINGPINFPLQHKRYFRVKATVGTFNARYWGASCISAFNTTGSTPIDTGDNVNIALNKTATNSVGNAGSIFDGDPSSGGGVGTVIVDLGAVYPIGRIEFLFNNFYMGLLRVGISSSNDKTTWNTQQFLDFYQDLNIIQEVMGNYSCRYLKFDFPSYYVGGSGYTHPSCSEIEVYKSKPQVVGPHKNIPPTVSITAPVNKTTIFAAPQNVTITASATDYEGPVKKVDFYNGTTLLGTASSLPYTYTWNSVAVGTYYLTATATDDSGATSTSAIDTITLSTATPPAQLSRTGWTATASSSNSGDNPGNALDNNKGTRWSTGAVMAANQWFQVDMKGSAEVSQVILVSTNGDRAYGYEVYVSTDAANMGTAVATGSSTSDSISITFAAKRGQYIKILQTASGQQKWFAINELYVYGANFSATGVSRGIIPQVSTGKVPSNIQFYSITGRRIDMRTMRASGAGLYLSKTIGNSVSVVKPKVMVR